ENPGLPAFYKQCAIADVRDERGVVRCDHEGAIRTFFEQLFIALLLKARISDRNKFVNQITVELDGQRKAKCEAGPHPRRIVLSRLLERGSKFGEIVNPGQGFLIVPSIQ